MDVEWRDRAFAELSAAELHALYALRARVFVVEQACAYQDPDDLDPVSRHLWAERGGRILACLRIIPARAKHAEVCIGRVATAPEARGTGLGRELVRRALAATGGAPLRIGAQAYLERFWSDFGFVRVSDVYDEDGIPHIEMTRAGA